MGAEDGKEESEEAPQDFRCPECCMKRACPYAHYHNLPAESVRRPRRLDLTVRCRSARCFI